MEEKLLTIRDVALLLGVSEKEVMDMAEAGSIPAYKIGGVYLRFRKDQIDEFRKEYHPPAHKHSISHEYSLRERVIDFFYYNDFYIFAFIVVMVLLFVVFKF